MRKNLGKLVELEDLENLLVVGDLHGDYESFKEILKQFEGRGEGTYIVFLGDYADRGPNGVEILEELMRLKSSERVVLLKGNHEDYSQEGFPRFSPCTLIQEVELKIGDWNSYFKSKLEPFFRDLYLAALVNKRILLLHGGISSRIKSVEDLKSPTRKIEEDVIWSDPSDEEGEVPNWRGAGVEFGRDVTKKVLSSLNACLLIRSHQPRLARDYIHFSHENLVVTISSTRVYGGVPQLLDIPGERIEEICRNPVELKKYVYLLK